MSGWVRGLTFPTLIAVVTLACGVATRANGQGGNTAKRSFWFLALTGEQGYDANVLFGTTRVPDNVSRLNAALSVFRRLQTGTVGLTASGGALRYVKTDQLNNYYYGLSANAEKRVTAHFTTAFQAGYDTRLTTDLAGGGLNLPLLRLAKQQVITGSVRATEQFSARTEGVFSANYLDARFDSPTVLPGRTVALQTTVTHRYSPYGAVVLDANATQGKTQGLPVSVQTVLAGWQPGIRALTFRVLAGVTHAASNGPSVVVPAASVIIADTVGPGMLSLGTSYSSVPALGLGGVITNAAVGFSYDLQAARGNFVTISGVSALSKQNFSTTPNLRSEALSTSLRRVFKSGITMTLSTNYRARKDFTLAKGLSAQAGFGYTFGSR